MANPNPERDERVSAAPERIFLRAWHPDSPNHNCSWDVSKTSEGSVEYVRADLSAIETFVGPCVGCGHNNYDTKRKECKQRWMEGRYSVVCGCPCATHNSLANAATHIRDRCLEKVKEMHDEYDRDADAAYARRDLTAEVRLRTKRDAASEIMIELQSLTLDVEEKQ